VLERLPTAKQQRKVPSVKCRPKAHLMKLSTSEEMGAAPVLQMRNRPPNILYILLKTMHFETRINGIS